MSQNYDGPYIVVNIEGKKATLNGLVLEKNYGLDRLKLYQKGNAGSGEEKPKEEHSAEPRSDEDYSAEEESQRESKNKTKIIDFIKRYVRMENTVRGDKENFQQWPHAYWVDSCPVFSFGSEVTFELLLVQIQKRSRIAGVIVSRETIRN